MIIQDIFAALKIATNPVARIYSKNSGIKILFIGFNKGMVLAKHKTLVPARLLVIKGHVRYLEADKKVELFIYDEFNIPIDVTHEIMALEESLCMLVQGIVE